MTSVTPQYVHGGRKNEVKKFVDRIDHVCWLSRLENIEENVIRLEGLSGVKMEFYENRKTGLSIYISWEAGLEVVAPLAARTDFNQSLHDWLETHGEGLYAVTFGVRSLDQHMARLKAKRFEVGPLMGEGSVAPWTHKVRCRERKGPIVIGTLFIFGDIQYMDGVVEFVNE